MALFAMWVPGSAAVVELTTPQHTQDVGGRAWTAVAGLRQSAGTTYRCAKGSTMIFHFPIPTPVIVGGSRASFQRAMAFYNARPGITLKNVLVLDGGTLVGNNAVSCTGDHQPFPNALVNQVTSFAVGAGTAVKWGIDLALTFQFTADQDLTMYTAGVDFDVP